MKKALFIIGGEWHRYEACAEILAAFLKGHGSVDCTVTQDRDAFRKLEGYDVVIAYTQGGKLTEPQERGLCDWVSAGGAFVGIHSAADSWVENERYMEMIGSRFETHGPVTEFIVNVSDLAHDVTRGVGEFRVTDEFYILKRRTEADLHWLMSGNWRTVLHPMAYVREYGKGRVFYTALGHDERAFHHPSFQKLIYRAIWWTTRSTKPGPVRFGVVGYGGAFGMGKCHADSILKTPGLELTAVCEVDPARLKVAAEEQPGAQPFDSVEKLAASGTVDAAVIVTPHNTHAPIALTLLEAGVGVVCEKPFCLTIDEATRMIDAARERSLLLTAFHNRRWDADFMTLRNIIAEGWLGEVFHVEAYMGQYKHPGYWWRSHKPVSGGVMYDWGAHFVDWILNLMPHRMESVTGFLSTRVWHDVTDDDHGKAIIRFEGGRSAELEVSNASAAGKPKFRILGTKGGLTANWDPPVHVTTHAHGDVRKMDVPFVESRWAIDFYAGVRDHLLGGEPLPVTPESARRVIAVLELAEKSSETGQAEPVPHER